MNGSVDSARIEGADFPDGQFAFKHERDFAGSHGNPGIHVVGCFFPVLGCKGEGDMEALVFLIVELYLLDSLIMDFKNFLLFAGEYVDGCGLPFPHAGIVEFAHEIER